MSSFWEKYKRPEFAEKAGLFLSFQIYSISASHAFYIDIKSHVVARNGTDYSPKRRDSVCHHARWDQASIPPSWSFHRSTTPLPDALPRYDRPPLLVDSFTKHPQIILFDNAGIGHSSGPVDNTLTAMGAHIIEFLTLLNIKKVDILGFSLGGVVAPFCRAERSTKSG